MANNAIVTEMIQWLQKSYIEVPGTVFVEGNAMYQNYTSSCQSTITKSKFHIIAQKIFSNCNFVYNRGTKKYVGLRLSFKDDKFEEVDLNERATFLGYFNMTSSGDSETTLGLATGLCVNKNELIKTIKVQPDKSFRLFVGEREVNVDEIGLTGLLMDTCLSIKTVLNTFKQAVLCQGRLVDSKVQTKKFSIVQEWTRKGNENSKPSLKLTSKKCCGIVLFTANSTICSSCIRQNLDNDKLNYETTENCGSTVDVLKQLFPNAHDLMINFLDIQSEMAISDKDKRSRRWNKQVIQVCLSLWNRSPEAYSSLRNSGMLILPSESLLSRYKNCLHQSPGINEEMFIWMLHESQNLKTGKSGGLILDEMAVQEDLQMSFKNGNVSIDGLVNVGNFADNMKLLNKHTQDPTSATHVMQFIFLGFDGFRFPIAYFPTAGANAPEIYDMSWRVINKLYEYGFDVEYVCMDGCSNNRTFQLMHFQDVADAKEKMYTVINPSCPSQSISMMMDYSHNIKKLRNSISASGKQNTISGSEIHEGRYTRTLTKDDQQIVWGYWIEAYTWDKLYNSNIRVHQKLTDEHIYLTQTSKMRNHLAEQVMDRDMLNLMVKYKESQFNGSRFDFTISLLEHTSRVIEVFRDRRPIMSINDTRLTELVSFKDWLDEWEKSVSDRNDLSATERNKCFITRETYNDIASMVLGFISLVKRRVKIDKQSLTAAGVNSDIVENFFCIQRTINNGSNHNPTVHQYKYAINATVLGQNAVSKKSNAYNKRKLCQPFNFSTPKSLGMKKPYIRL